MLRQVQTLTSKNLSDRMMILGTKLVTIYPPFSRRLSRLQLKIQTDPPHKSALITRSRSQISLIASSRARETQCTRIQSGYSFRFLESQLIRHFGGMCKGSLLILTVSLELKRTKRGEMYHADQWIMAPFHHNLQLFHFSLNCYCIQLHGLSIPSLFIINFLSLNYLGYLQ
ncbi:hypothetical protein F5879DRAFT_1019806 [Lentinula edodes]|nr:hypothetical protein F5879DRAFT_1019806 [Lentinula edodes]